MHERIHFVDARRFKEAALAGKHEGLGLHKAFTCDELKAIDVERRIIDFVISTAAVDREGDTIAVDGWELESFRKNPVILFAHDHREPPIARALSIGTDGARLAARAEFMAPDLSAFSYMIFRMYAEGFMKATSVGFQPLEWSFTEEADRKLGIDFSRQELLEFSAVPVPANPEALVQARAKGIDTGPLKQWAERVLDGWGDRNGVVLTRKSVERLRKAADPKHVRRYHLPRRDQDELLRRNLAVQKAEARVEPQLQEPRAGGADVNAEPQDHGALLPGGPQDGAGAKGAPEAASQTPCVTSPGGPRPEEAVSASPASRGQDGDRAPLAELTARIARMEATVRTLADRLAGEDEGTKRTTLEPKERATSEAVLRLTHEAPQQHSAADATIHVDETMLARLVRDVVSEKLRAITGRVD